jgi:6,7-dimethyl-8-ribityllumazine synthase
MTDTLKIAFIKANWHTEIVDQVLKGFESDMAAKGRKVAISVYDVPGAFEMPLLAKKLGETGRFDAIVAAALVVNGGIYRHEFVAQAVVTGLMDAQMATGIPTFSVSLTPHHFHDSEVHHDFYFDHFVKKGAEAANAVRMIADLKI